MNTTLPWDRARAAARTLLLAIALIAVPSAAWAQTSRYTLEGPVSRLKISLLGDSIVAAAGLGAFLGSYPLESLKPAPSISGLSIADVPAFDRLAYTTSYSSTLGYVSDGTVAGAVLLPLILVPGKDRNDIITGVVVYSESVGLSYAAKNLIKALVIRYRPYAYGPAPPSSLVSTSDVEDSFPSGHVTVAFAAAVTGGMLFDRFDAKPLDRALYWSAAMGLATGTAVLRVASGNHFLSDVVGGAALGSLVGFLVPYLHTVEQGGAASGAQGLSFFPALPVTAAGDVPLVQWGFRF